MQIEEILSRDDVPEDIKAYIGAELQLCRETQHRNQQRRALLINAANSLNNSLSLSTTLDEILDQVKIVQGVVGCSIWLLDCDGATMTCRLANGLGAETITGWQLDRNTGIAGWVLEHNESLLVNDAATDGRHFEGINEVTHLGIRSLITVPMTIRGKTIGVLQVVDDGVDRFSPEDLETMETLAAAAALAVDNAQLFTLLQDELQERKNMEKALEVSNDAKNRLFSIIAHDLKSPFTSILHFSEVISNDLNLLNREQLQKLAGELGGTTRKVNELLDNLLLWSRSQLGQITCSPESFPLGAMVENTMELLRRNAFKKDIHLINNVPPNTIINNDRNLTETILRNLLSNAIKFTHRGGRVITDVSHREDTTIISVIDNGIGIPEDRAAAFFEKGYRSTPGTENEPGYGLGLTLCQAFAEQCGGSLYLESTPKEGSIFRFHLPNPG